MRLRRVAKQFVAIILGMLTVLKHCFKRPVTLEYPEVKPDCGKYFRGKHQFDAAKCVACGVCANVCPAGAITIEREKAAGGGFKLKKYSINYEKCIFCGNCYNYCSTGAIVSTKDFELATTEKSALNRVLEEYND